MIAEAIIMVPLLADPMSGPPFCYTKAEENPMGFYREISSA